MRYMYKTTSMDEMVDIFDKLKCIGFTVRSDNYPSDSYDHRRWPVITYDDVEKYVCASAHDVGVDVTRQFLLLNDFIQIVGLKNRDKHHGSKLVFNFT